MPPLLTGRMPTDIGVDWNKDNTRIPESETMLAEHLKSAGYMTAGFINAYYVWPIFGFGDGFDIYARPAVGSQPQRGNGQRGHVRVAGQNLAAYLQDKPLFLYLYYYDPHTVYEPPAPYDVLYDSTYTGTLTSEVYANAERVMSGEIVPDTARH